ncbi:hypothetical protein DM01DRAFT_1410169 [Hesseltinella vesiculosa]|uniref:BZIP domain-containing protein n=1 Tax=Hesseltinella vesiculosa TaxID=101127 RepID=A0A1X2G7Z2_9FUNG|nr:hypothetical protein DM01DRAFT_1410169 [Hesseltinella vesiculosa]
MADYPYYLSPLDALAFDVASPAIDQDTAAADLALWTNAQFTFDVKPGSGIYDDEEVKPNNDITYEKLANYIDYELPRQQQQQQQQPLAPKQPSSPPVARQILPKPLMMDPLQLASLLTAPVPAPAKKASRAKTAVKRPVEDVSPELVAAEEDKRRRNTAASARFRIKKKMREQAMEQTVKEMTQKSDLLQARVDELELEVKWLRGLLTEKERSA